MARTANETRQGFLKEDEYKDDDYSSKYSINL